MPNAPGESCDRGYPVNATAGGTAMRIYTISCQTAIACGIDRRWTETP